MTLPFDDHNVSAQSVLQLADSMRNDESQSSDQPTGEEGRIPYDRFKEVNDERKRLQDQVDTFIKMQQQAQQQNIQQPQVQEPPQDTGYKSLFSEAELEQFQENIVLDPKQTLKQLTEAIMTRGVDAKTKQLEQKFEERFSQFTNQQATQQLPAVIDNFKRNRFDQSMGEEAKVFDEALKTIDPVTLANPATLENIRLAAIGYVADQRRQNPQQYNQRPQLPFSETPGGGKPGGFGGLSPQNNNQFVPAEVTEAAKRMGVDPNEAARMYLAMNQSGVFR